MHRFDVFPSDDLISLYRHTFSSGHGHEVLLHMLYDLGVFFQVDSGEYETALRNYGERLLSILAGGDIGKESIELFTKQLMRQPLPKKKE